MGRKINNIFDQIVSEENLYWAYTKARRGAGKFTKDSMVFSCNLAYNIYDLRRELISGAYQFSGYTTFLVTEPKVREISAPKFRDKIVQLAINNILKEYYNKSFINTSYASIDGKGTQRCALKIQEHMRCAKATWGEEAYVVKGDVRKFFYSIDREILKQILSRKIKDKRALGLLFTIIDSSASLSELGLPLGNTISQLCANIYLNELDQYCKRELRLKYYVRYMDDFFISVESRDKAREVLELAKSFLINRLHLEANKEKSQIFPISQGVNAVGYKIHTTHMLLRDDSKRRIKRKIKAFPLLILGTTNTTSKTKEKVISTNKANQMLESWVNHASLANEANFLESISMRFPYVCVDLTPAITKIGGAKRRMYLDMSILEINYKVQASATLQRRSYLRQPEED